MSVLTGHLRGEALLRELVRLLAQDLGHRIGVATTLGQPRLAGSHQQSALLVHEAAVVVDALDEQAARQLSLDPIDRDHGHIAKPYVYVPTAYSTGRWEGVAALWINPALGIARVHRGAGTVLLRGAFAVTPTLAGRAERGGYFDRWVASQLEAGAVKWRNGVRTARLEGFAIPEDQQELAFSPVAAGVAAVAGVGVPSGAGDDPTAAGEGQHDESFTREVVPCGSRETTPRREQHPAAARFDLPVWPPPPRDLGRSSRG